MQVGERTYETDALPSAWYLVISSRTVRAKIRLRNKSAEFFFDYPPRLVDREKVRVIQHFSRAHRHQFDKS